MQLQNHIFHCNYWLKPLRLTDLIHFMWLLFGRGLSSWIWGVRYVICELLRVRLCRFICRFVQATRIITINRNSNKADKIVMCILLWVQTAKSILLLSPEAREDTGTKIFFGCFFFLSFLGCGLTRLDIIDMRQIFQVFTEWNTQAVLTWKLLFRVFF